MAHLLNADRIGLTYPTTVVFEAVTCGLDDGDRIGIVGRNGDGKSSLLNLLGGRLAPTSGQVTQRTGLRVGFLGQGDDLPDDPATSVGTALFGTRETYQWASDPAQRAIVDGLLAGIGLEQAVGALSGGERRRVALAAVLVGEWDVLALDEPTNHLDLEAIWWLAGHLKTRWGPRSGGLLVVTHDRWFLDEVVQTTWEVHDGAVEPFSGGYAAYVLARVERDRQAALAEAKRRNLMRKELAWLRRGAPARTAKPRFRIDAANALIADVPELRNPVALHQMAMARLGKKVIDLEDAGFAYGGTPVLRDVTWRIAPGERTGILGANGAGKSTLLGLVSGALAPTSGRVTRGQTVRVGVLDQTYAGLDEVADDLVRDVIARLKTTFTVDGRDLSPAQMLERLGFSSAHLSTRVADLSGGQKRRLMLLLVLCEEPNVLLLDEPTNDVDTDMLMALEDLLDSWPGTLLVISHDRYFVDRVTDRQYVVADHRLRHLPGGIDEYLRLATTGPAPAPASREKPPSSPVGEQRALRKQLGTLEAKMTKAGAAIDALVERLHAVDPADWQRLHALGQDLDEARRRHADLETQWLEVAERLEG